MTKNYLTMLSEEELVEIIQGALRKELTEKPSFEKAEIINRDELCKRLDITEPTVIRWEKKGAIPCFRVGSSVRYNWTDVIEALKK